MKKPLFWLVCLVLPIAACEAKSPSENLTEKTVVQTDERKQKVSAYYFGHSLVWHTPPKIATPKDETAIPHWMSLLAEANGKSYKADGQFGFLRDHAKLPPKDQWRLENVTSAWMGNFSQTPYTDVVLTAANFVQYQDPNKPYYDSKTDSPYSVTLEILDYVLKEAPDATFWVYENWADMGSYARDFPNTPANPKKIASYYDYMNSDFHNWWHDYVAMLKKARPKADIRMIPVGSIFSEIFTQAPLNQIPLADLYEDDAPHGRSSTYFIAALIHYRALFGGLPKDSFTLPETIHPLIKENFAALLAKIDELYVKKTQAPSKKGFW